MGRRMIGGVQIILLLVAVFAFASILSDAFQDVAEASSAGPRSLGRVNAASDHVAPQQDRKKSLLPPLLAGLGKLVFSERGLVSALEESDLQEGTHTCLLGNDGAYCQEYIASDCADACSEACIPTTREFVAACKPGTCFDPIEGKCQAGAPRVLCEEHGGEWIDDPFENVAQCREGCCVLGDQTDFTTERQCSRQANVLGVDFDYRPEIRTEIECLALARTQEEGACVFEEEIEGVGQRNCVFSTRSACLAVRGAEFHPGLLCSHPDLNTICVRQSSTDCVDDRDEVYWFDSCGNRENIYDANKAGSFNDGRVQPKGESCELATDQNEVARQSTCGNCNYLLGSRCGARGGSERLADSAQEVVCRKLACKDDDGNERKNGESWCVYQSKLGTDGDPPVRSREVPGSRHYRQVCLDGEVRTEPCADFRNGICVEDRVALPGGGEFANAACRTNLWQQCLDYNSQIEDDPDEGLRLCNENPDCYMNEVNLVRGDKDSFKFSMCVPAHPAGFNLRTRDTGLGGTAICQIGSQTCTYVEVKSFTGKWKCKANCACKGAEFAEDMHDLCMSIGDCGSSVNYAGTYKKNHGVKGASDLGGSYVNRLKTYDNVDPDDYLKADVAALAGILSGAPGFGEGIGEPGDPDTEGDTLKMLSYTAGGLGTVMATIGALAPAAFAGGFFGGAGGLVGAGKLAFDGGVLSTVGAKGALTPVAGNMGAMPFGAAFMGAVIGIAVVGLALNMLGLEGIEPEIAYTLMAAGAVAGTAIGLGTAGAGSAAFAKGALTFGWVTAVVVIAIIVIFKLLGVGKKREKKVEFNCRPWQAPLGGSECGKCDSSSGLGCSKYQCHSLGQTCELLNAGTEEQVCENISPHDVVPPILTPRDEALVAGTKYEGASVLGVEVKASDGDGCVKEYQELGFGFDLDEPGQCRYDFEHTTEFDEMSEDFGGLNLFVKEHEEVLRMPSLTELGLTGFDPSRRADVELFVRCQDANGNSHAQEYAVQYCVKPAEDMTPPIVRSRTPVRVETKVDAVNISGGVYVNEPAECRWSDVDQGYDLMTNELTCLNDFTEETALGFLCLSDFPVVEDEEEYFVRCKDQPWLDFDDDVEREGTRNAMSKGFSYKIERTAEALEISSVSPDNETLTFGQGPVSVELVVETSGGLDGTAECSYEISGQSIPFFTTFTRTHRQEFQSFSPGEKVLPLTCVDQVGNVAERTARFTLEIDSGAPIVTRVYQQAGSLVVITDEAATCAWSPLDCSFAVDDANEDSGVTVMTGSGNRHSTNFDAGTTYHVKCVDTFGNRAGQCQIIVRGGI